jgi:hypothetical protein
VSNTNWISVATYSDRASAEAILGLLTGEGVPAYIKSDEYVPGLGLNFSVSVPPDLARRAQWLLQRSDVTEAELARLATGDSDPPAGD